MNWNIFLGFLIGFLIGYLFDIFVIYKQKTINKINSKIS